MLTHSEHSYYKVGLLCTIELNFCVKVPFNILSNIDIGFIPRKRTVFKFQLFYERILPFGSVVDMRAPVKKKDRLGSVLKS